MPGVSEQKGAACHVAQSPRRGKTIMILVLLLSHVISHLIVRALVVLTITISAGCSWIKDFRAVASASNSHAALVGKCSLSSVRVKVEIGHNSIKGNEAVPANTVIAVLAAIIWRIVRPNPERWCGKESQAPYSYYHYFSSIIIELLSLEARCTALSALSAVGQGDAQLHTIVGANQINGFRSSLRPLQF